MEGGVVSMTIPLIAKALVASGAGRVRTASFPAGSFIVESDGSASEFANRYVRFEPFVESVGPTV